MTKVSLRNYDREIEGLIDGSRLDEAIAHCRHILQTFPKHLDTYRLLGKALLESKRYDEAVDIFSRVLRAVPDDFVSHVGMSIIRDEQNRLDEAISHMERAFESQPSNAAIQNELQRLFGRRDGVEPTKIRMNRGALAHMYLQGELYPQAISEIKAVLAADSQREDMKALLARAYFHAGQKADASDICLQLLNTYTYSFDANRIMSELLQGSEAENGKAYRDRVIELDPYAAHSTASVFRSNEVPDAAVSLEHLEYHGEEFEPAPEWKPEGIGAPASDEQPDWLKKDYSMEAEEPPAPRTEPQADLPEFMRAAGWTAATGAAVEPPPLAPEESTLPEEELTPGEMPDWLKAMAPQDLEAPITPEIPSAAEPEEAAEDWLKGLQAQQVEPQAPAGMPTPVLSEEPSDDWFKDLEPLQAEAQMPPVETPATALPEDLSDDWLKDLEAQQKEAEIPPEAPVAAFAGVEASAWSFEQPGESPDSEKTEETPEIPDWLKNVEATEPGMAPSTAEASLPDWLKPAGEEPAPEPAAPEPSIEEFPPLITPVEPLTPPPSLESLGTSVKEQDDALAWLESLAAKHGAKAEELISDPNARTEKPPEWVEQARALGEGQPVSPEAAPQEPVFLVPEPEPPAAPAQPVVPEEPFVPSEPVMPGLEALQFETPETMPMIEPEPETPVQPFVEPVQVEEPVQPVEPAQIEPEPEPAAPALPAEPEPLEPFSDATGIWLRSLEEKESSFKADEAEIFASATSSMDIIKPLEAPETPFTEPEPTPAEPLPAMEEEPQAVPTESSDLPDWLRDIDQEEKWPQAVPVDEDEIPAWLQGESEPVSEVEPAQPTDWRPAESISEVDLTQAEMAAVPEPPQEYLKELQELREQPLETEPEPAAASLEEPIAAAVEREAELEPELEEEAEMEPPQPPTPIAEAPTPVQPQPVSRPAAPRRPVPRPQFERRPTAVDVGEGALTLGRNEMNRGNIPAALDQYGKLIKKGRFLEEIIHDMREALYRYPVEITIWQTLGDAFMRENRLQEALDAYTKAEELLR